MTLTIRRACLAAATALLAFFAVALMPGFAQDSCRYLSGAERSQCNHDAAAARAAANRAAAHRGTAPASNDTVSPASGVPTSSQADTPRSAVANLNARPHLSQSEAAAQANLSAAEIDRKDYASGFTHADAACYAGAAAACFNLGLLYENGWGVRPDMAQAAELYGKACQLNSLGGYRGGCLRLGFAYYRGQGVPQDKARALRLYEASCLIKDGEACRLAGVLLLNGDGVPQDKTQALTYIRGACDAQNASGCDLLEREQPGSRATQEAELDKLRRDVEHGVPLLIYERGLEMVPGSLTIAPAAAPWQLAARFSYKRPDGSTNTATFNAMLRGDSSCIVESTSVVQTCQTVPETQAEAERVRSGSLHEKALQTELAQAQSGGATAPMKAADQACLQSHEEPYVETVETGGCLEFQRLPGGGGYCARKETKTVQHFRTYEINICRRPIKFMDKCGSTVFAMNEVLPGTRFDPKLGSPCVRVQ